MGHKKIPEATKLEAMQLYVADGLTLVEISDRLGLSLRTIKGWSTRQQWREQRKQAIYKAQRSIYVQIQTKVANTTMGVLSTAELGAKLCYQAMTAIAKEIEGDPSKLEAKYKDIAKWIELACSIGKAQRNVMPTADKELSERILAELKRLGRAGIYPAIETEEK